jgi:hypothetical protein
VTFEIILAAISASAERLPEPRRSKRRSFLPPTSIPAGWPAALISANQET